MDESPCPSTGTDREVGYFQMGVDEQIEIMGYDDPMRYIIEEATRVNKNTLVLLVDSIKAIKPIISINNINDTNKLPNMGYIVQFDKANLLIKRTHRSNQKRLWYVLAILCIKIQTNHDKLTSLYLVDVFQQTLGYQKGGLSILAIVVWTCKRVEGSGEIHRRVGDK